MLDKFPFHHKCQFHATFGVCFSFMVVWDEQVRKEKYFRIENVALTVNSKVFFVLFFFFFFRIYWTKSSKFLLTSFSIIKTSTAVSAMTVESRRPPFRIKASSYIGREIEHTFSPGLKSSYLSNWFKINFRICLENLTPMLFPFLKRAFGRIWHFFVFWSSLITDTIAVPLTIK